MKEQLDDLKAIREMMEKSSKFLSLSGLSGVMAGVSALTGASFAYMYLKNVSEIGYTQTITLIITALLVLLFAFSFALFFSWRKAKRNNQKLFNSLTWRILYNMAVPLTAGGLLALIMIYRGQGEFAASITLIFYGLSLINASKFMMDEIHYLGLTEVILGILSAVFICHGLLFWTLGFGICHIIYGAIMYKKYDLR